MKNSIKTMLLGTVLLFAGAGCQPSKTAVIQKTQTEEVDALTRDFTLVRTITGATNSMVSLNESGWAKTFVTEDSLGTTVVTISNMASYHQTMSRTGGPTMGLLENKEDYFIWEEKHPHPKPTQPGELPELVTYVSRVVTDTAQRAEYLKLVGNK